MVPSSFGGHEWWALPQGALWWPARRALLVADLHLEKASWFAARGQMLPPYDSLATLAALDAVIARLDPAEIWCLGDSFHDAGGAARLAPEAAARLAALAGGRRWVWLTGNHDPLPRGVLPGAVLAEALVDGVMLRHEARAGEGASGVASG